MVHSCDMLSIGSEGLQEAVVYSARSKSRADEPNEETPYHLSNLLLDAWR